jgi:hypothetical protein
MTMAINAGYKSKVELTGTAVAFVGEAVTATGNLTYQITDASKQVLDRTIAINVHKRVSNNNVCISGTTSTTIKFTNHGLVTGDLIVNRSRGDAKRIVTKVDNDTLTVLAITGQVTGDGVDYYPTEATTAYTMNRLIGKATYASAVARTILISGSYLPLVEATQCNETEFTLTANNEDVTVFGNSFVNRATTMKDFSCSISGFYADSTNEGYLLNGEAKVYTYYLDRTGAHFLKAWVIPASVAGSASPDAHVTESLEFEGIVDADGRTVSLNI